MDETTLESRQMKAEHNYMCFHKGHKSPSTINPMSRIQFRLDQRFLKKYSQRHTHSCEHDAIASVKEVSRHSSHTNYARGFHSTFFSFRSKRVRGTGWMRRRCCFDRRRFGRDRVWMKLDLWAVSRFDASSIEIILLQFELELVVPSQGWVLGESGRAVVAALSLELAKSKAELLHEVDHF